MSAAAALDTRPLPTHVLAGLRGRMDRWGLAVLLGASVAVLVGVPGLLPLALLGGTVGLVAAAVRYASLRSNAVPIGTGIAASWGPALASVRARTGTSADGLPVVLQQDPLANAVCLWSPTGRCVVLTSGLAHLLADDPPAQQFVLAHETGHAVFHQPWAFFASTLAAGLGLLAPASRLGTLFWTRAAERSADRLGLLVCGSPLAATRALLAVHGGIAVADADVRAVLRTLPRRPGGLWGYLAEAFATHPFLRPRLEALYAYAASPAYARAAGLPAAEEVAFELAALGSHPGPAGWAHLADVSPWRVPARVPGPSPGWAPGPQPFHGGS